MNGRFVPMNTSPGCPAGGFTFTHGTFVVGRSSDSSFVIKDPTVSRRHAEITVNNAGITVRDLGSCNGTFVNQQRVTLESLTPGQQVRFGGVSFLVTTDHPGDIDSEMETRSCTGEEAGKVQADALSAAQNRVLQFVLGGLSEKQIAGKLCISVNTVHNHMRAIYRAFQVHSRPELLSRFLPHGSGASSALRLPSV